MTSKALLALGILLGLLGCQAGDSLSPPDEVDPAPLTVAPVDRHTIQISWAAVAGAQRYELARRQNLRGDFVVIVEDLPRSRLSYVDRNLEPETIYGYRLRAYNDLGQLLGTTPVAGGETPPEAGIEVVVQSALGGDPNQSIDSSGYRLTLKGAGLDQQFVVGVSGRQVLRPLPPGNYSVGLEDLAAQCVLEGPSPRVVAVTDQGLATTARVAFEVRCRDRTRGQVRGVVATSGEGRDSSGYQLVLSGIVNDPSLPESERAFVQIRSIGGEGGTTLFENLRPGRYSLLLDDVSALCTVTGARQRDSLDVVPLGAIEEEFQVSCSASDETGDRPFTYRAAWDRSEAPTGTAVRVRTTLDLSPDPTADLRGFQFAVETPHSVVRFDSVVTPSPGWSLTSNAATAGQVLVVATRTTPARGLVPLVDLYYTVIGATGQTAVTRTVGLTLAAPDGTPLDDRVRRVEGSLSVGTGSGVNQPPSAVANGPYQANVGQPVSFSAAGSSDPDGQIQTYRWDFGDGQQGNGATVQHTYAAAGTYTAVLTVTDDKGATASSQAQVTIAIVDDPNPTERPFTWKGTFGSVNSATGLVTLTISLDLTADIPQTPGIERLQRYVVDSLHWDPAVLQYASFRRGVGTGTVNFTQAFSRGLLAFQGNLTASQGAGVVAIASIDFRVIGASGDSSRIRTALGALTGTASLDYRSRTQIDDPVYTVSTAPAPGTTTVSGSVTSPTRGPISGAMVTLSAGGGSTTTGSDGAYRIAGVQPGQYTLAVGGLPSGCTAPSAVSITVGTTPLVRDFSVTCTAAPATGTVTGTVGFTAGSATPSLSSILVTVTPTGGTALTTTVNDQRSYSRAGVPAGDGTGRVAVSNVPTGCVTPGSIGYTGLVAGGTITVPEIRLTCSAPAPDGYPLALTWSAVAGGKATLTARIDMGALNDPGNNGSAPDRIGVAQLRLRYPVARLTAPVCAPQGGFSGVINTAGAGDVGVVLTNLSGATGNVTLFTCTFDVAGSGPTSVVIERDTDFVFGDQTGYEFTSRVVIQVSALP